METEQGTNAAAASDAGPGIEQWLIGVFREFFPTDAVDASSDFFDLGGNSLTAIKLISRADAEYGADVLLPDVLFDNGQIRHLAAAMALALASSVRDGA